MNNITYLLSANDDTCDEYYRKISLFTDEVIEKSNEVGYEILESYRNYIIDKKIEIPKEKLIYNLELIMIGVYWTVYIKKADYLSKSLGKIFSKLVYFREKNTTLKPIIDIIRGIVGNKLLLKENSKTQDIYIENDIDSKLNKLKKLTYWLKASGEFTQESKRIDIWIKYLNDKDKIEVNNIILKSIELGEWFEIKSKNVLGSYTKDVDSFIEQNHNKSKWTENYIFRNRKRVEYHLNMVGAEIMNRGFRYDFSKTKEKRILLPICIREKLDGDCKSYKSNKGYLCSNCSKTCTVNELTILGKQHNFKVYIIPHSSSAFTKETVENGEVGIIGVACVLNLISGGFKAKDLGFEPQCILLKYSGCKKHWHEKGLTTGIDLKRLMDILEIKSYNIKESRKKLEFTIL